MPTPTTKAKTGLRTEASAVTKARTAVNAAAAEFETARQAMADAGEAMRAATNKEFLAKADAFKIAKDAYAAAGNILGRAQQALTAAQAVKK